MSNQTSRRSFLQLVAASGVACACGGLSGCASKGDPTLTSDVVLQLADYPTLAQTGGIARVPKSVSGHDYDIFVRNEGSGMYRALSAWCSHADCSVSTTANGFRCPCHGATFNEAGDRTGGPAPKGLIMFDTNSDATTVTILANA